MVFNARMMNRDDHLKSHAFLMDQFGVWKLAPAYDVSFSLGPGGEHTLLIAGEGRQPGKRHFLAVAKQVGIKDKRANEIVGKVDDAVRERQVLLRRGMYQSVLLKRYWGQRPRHWHGKSGASVVAALTQKTKHQSVKEAGWRLVRIGRRLGFVPIQLVQRALLRFSKRLHYLSSFLGSVRWLPQLLLHLAQLRVDLAPVGTP